MNEKFIFGQDLSASEKKKFEKELLEIKKESQEKIEGEYEKSEEELKFIGLVNKYIAQEFKELGIGKFPGLKPDQFHIISRSSYEKLDFHKDSIGYMNPMQSVAYANKDAVEHRLELYKNILHEAVHLSSIEKNQAIEKDDGIYINNYRLGYTVSSNIEDDFGESHEHFRGLNEGITDMMVEDILKKHADELIMELKVKPGEEKKPINWYGQYKALMKEIIYRIAEEKGEKYEDVWSRFKRGCFTGEMMHFRDIERTFGKGSLRILASAFRLDVNDDGERHEIDEKIFEYFDAVDEDERNKLAGEILNEREFESYLKRKS